MEKNNQDLELILLDKCTFQNLKSEELEIVFKYKILVPDIFLIENLKRKETLNKLSYLKNIYWVRHWGLLVKETLLGQQDRIITVTLEDITEITSDPEELKKQMKLAKKVAKYYDDFPRRLLQKNVDLSSKGNKNRIVDKIISELERYGEEVTDDMIKTAETEFKKRESLFTIEHSNWEKLSQIIVDELNNKPIWEEERHLKENQRAYIRNKEWLDFACVYFQVTQDEKTQIFKRWEEKYNQNLKYFAPYAYYILALELTIALRVMKSKGNYKREIMRDLGYIYYANFSNVTFHTCDRQLKETIYKIPFLRHIQNKMVYFYNDNVKRDGELNKSDWLKKLEDAHNE